MTDPSTPDDDPNHDPREAFEVQVNNAFASAMQATHALWQLKSALETENRGGGVSWDRIEDNVWTANEAIGFAHTYVQDDIGVVSQFKELTDGVESYDAVTIFVNGQKHAVPVTIATPDALLRETGYNPDEHVLYRADLEDDDPITDAPVGFDAGDHFTVYPTEVEF